jgi:aryl-alcohol dehydrogenase-like predicted oxidoreductase
MTTHPREARVALGPTDIRISPMGVGAWAWGDRTIWGYGAGYGEADVHAAFDASLAAGVNFYDTAEAYGWGRSERLLGRFVQASGQPAVLASKFFPYPWRLSRAALLHALRHSLRRLGVARMDLYQLHRPFPPVPVEGWMDAMADAVEAGLLRAVGVSNLNVSQMQRAHARLQARGIPLASNQVRYSLLDRTPERSGLLETCRELNVTLIAYSPLAQGLLTGKYTPDHRPTGVRGMGMGAQALARIQPLVLGLQAIGDRHGGKSAAQVALNWVLCKGSLPIPGAKNARQAQENIGAMGWRLTPGEVAELDDMSDRLSSTPR